MDALIQQEASGSALTALDSTDPVNPAGVEARQELARIISDPTHPMHEGYTRADKQVMDHIEGMYTKAYGGSSAPGETGRSLATWPGETPEQDAMTREDRVAQTEVETMLRQTLGTDYDTSMRDMRIGASHLFSIPDGEKTLAAFAPIITELGPLAEVRAIRFLAELGEMIRTHKGA
jgi:hypothetical protein